MKIDDINRLSNAPGLLQLVVYSSILNRIIKDMGKSGVELCSVALDEYEALPEDDKKLPK